MSENQALKFDVIGHPVPQGSMSRGFGNRLHYSNDAKLKSWRHMVITETVNAMQRLDSEWNIDQAVKVSAVFRFTRPKKHYTASGALKASAPFWKATPSDTDKLARSIGDSLKEAGALRDDALIVQWDACKRWADESEPPGVYLIIEPAET